MRTVVVGERPIELEALIERRRALGQDIFDEVWDGEYHMVPAPHGRHGTAATQLMVALEPLARLVGLTSSTQFNLGGTDDYRVPDGGYHRGPSPTMWNRTAAIVVEILSPDDETWAKFGFYAAHEVDEICVADPVARTLQWFRRDGATYATVQRSDLLDVAVAEVAGGSTGRSEAGGAGLWAAGHARDPLH